MFTGLVQARGTVLATGNKLRLQADDVAAQVGRGDSVAVNGVCLTALGDGDLSFDVADETLRRSSLGALVEGGPVNLELALRAGDRLGGHVVQGHVDGTGRLAARRPEGTGEWLTVEPEDPALLRYVVEKGSITVDGVSLTVAAVDERSFSLALIPETLERTTLGAAEVGAVVNLEVDVLAKYVEKLTAGVRGA